MKRIVALALAMLMLVGLMTAGVAEEVVELTVLNYLDLTNANSSEEMTKVWAAFEEAHPNIKLNIQHEFNDPFHQAVEAYAAADNLPDVIYAWPSGRSTTLHTQKLLKDLGPLVERDGLASIYTATAMDPTAQAGGYMAILPTAVTATHAMFVNLEVLNDCGLTPAKTYAEMVEQVPVLAAKGYDCVLMPSQDTWVMQSCLFSMLAGRFMGEAWETKILSGETKFTDPDFIACLDFVKGMYDANVLNPNTLAVGYGEGPGSFANNSAAYYIDGDWRNGAFITDATTGEALISVDRQPNFLITVFPEIEGVKFNRSNSAVLGTGFGINAKLEDGSAKLEAAWELVKYLEGVEVQTYRLSTGGIASPSCTTIDYSALTLEPLQVAMANFGAEYDTATAVIDGVFEGPVYTPLNDGLQALALGTMTSQEVAEVTQAALEAWQAEQ